MLAALLLVRAEPARVAGPAKLERDRRARLLHADVEETSCSVRALALPTGAPPALSCREARRIIAEVQGKLAAPAQTPKAEAFAESLTGWLDPHGLWSAAPDSPVRARIRQEAAALLAEIEAPSRNGETCVAAARLGAAVRTWVDVLRTHFRDAPAPRDGASARSVFLLASEAIYEDDPVRRPAKQLAADLGARHKAFAWQHVASSAASAAPGRFFPEMSLRQWQAVVLSAAVRAYVPLVDPHGQWAPLDEEWSLYAGDFSLDLGPRLWGRMLRSALGVRVVDEPTPPLEVGDLVLAVGGVPTVGMSVEQVEQLSRLEPVGGESVREVVVWRAQDTALKTLTVPIGVPTPATDEGPSFEAERVPYAGGSIAVVTIADVPDGLGVELANWLKAAREDPEPLLGVLLDLRGNGGGSIDGASSAVGVFLPGAVSFPLRRRGGAVEVQRAWTPAPDARWTGPVAALVDGYTASAAEMIAGALSVYRRGPVLGARTFGKGCIQEYFDDQSGKGVLRLTTMVFALPDGRPLQGTGLLPDHALPVPSPRYGEAGLAASLPGWQGPDVRTSVQPGPAWPSAAGRFGPCADGVVCRALSRLGKPNRPIRAARATNGGAPRRASAPRPVQK